jgi:hypothetical protein
MRYAVYAAAKQLLEHMAFVQDTQHSDTTKIRTLYVTLDEARFYFPPDIVRFLSEIHASCERFMTHIAERERSSIDDAPAWIALAETLAADQSEHRALYASLPQRFEATLAFRQLTTSQ